MKIVVERSIRDKLQDFFSYLKKRATEDDHKDNRDLIADFVDKVLVFEIKRLANEDSTIEEQIEIPDNVMVEPLLKAKSKLNSAFDEYLKKLGADVDQSVEEEPKEEPLTQTKSQTNSETVRNGNGHKIEKVRDLDDNEKDILRTEFMAFNGQFLYKDCSKNLKPRMGSDIAIWQVTGFISYLHAEVARGNIILEDLPKYLEFLKEKYPSLSKQYDSPKFQQLRAQKTVAQSVTQTPARPSFRPGLMKRRS